MNTKEYSFKYCYSCENKEECFKNQWVITMDKDGRKCDNYKKDPEIVRLLED